jgi:inosine/xanthosine triphosphatase
MLVAIGSKNQTKVQAAREAFKHYEARVEGIDVPSGVSEQPFSDEETIQGAINRAYAALEKSGGKLGVGLEGGVQQTKFGMMLCNWGALVQEGKPPIISGGARILLPKEIEDRLLVGGELGPVMDDFMKTTNIRSREGAIGIFTNGLIPRKEMFLHVTTSLVGQYEYRNLSGIETEL